MASLSTDCGICKSASSLRTEKTTTKLHHLGCTHLNLSRVGENEECQFYVHLSMGSPQMQQSGVAAEYVSATVAIHTHLEKNRIVVTCVPVIDPDKVVTLIDPDKVVTVFGSISTVSVTNKTVCHKLARSKKALKPNSTCQCACVHCSLCPLKLYTKSKILGVSNRLDHFQRNVSPFSSDSPTPTTRAPQSPDVQLNDFSTAMSKSSSSTENTTALSEISSCSSGEHFSDFWDTTTTHSNKHISAVSLQPQSSECINSTSYYFKPVTGRHSVPCCRLRPRCTNTKDSAAVWNVFGAHAPLLRKSGRMNSIGQAVPLSQAVYPESKIQSLSKLMPRVGPEENRHMTPSKSSYRIVPRKMRHHSFVARNLARHWNRNVQRTFRNAGVGLSDTDTVKSESTEEDVDSSNTSRESEDSDEFVHGSLLLDWCKAKVFVPIMAELPDGWILVNKYFPCDL